METRYSKHTNKTKQAQNKSYSLARRLTLSLLIGGMFITNTANAMPTGGDVVTGNGSIGGVVDGVMNVTGNSSSANVVIKWQDFGIKAGETVNFKDMNAVLNYVTGNNKSEIFGKLNGTNVDVFLINPNGVLFGAGAEVSVGSLYVSTGKMTDSDLNNFNGTTPNIDLTNVTADVVNLGTIKADALTIEGNNVILANSADIRVGDINSNAVLNHDVTLKAKGLINVGYESDTAKTTINVGDGNTTGYEVRDYTKYGGTTTASLNYKGTDLSGTTKTINDCMLVSNVYELQNINSKLDGNYMLTKDIDASATKNWNETQAGNGVYEGFDPLGDDKNWFAGVFDGMDYTITGLTINRGSENNIGLVGCNYGTVQNVRLDGGSVTGNTQVGSVVGYNDIGGKVSNVYNSGDVTGNGDSTGGIVGLSKGIMSKLYNSGNVKGNKAVGGVVGHNERQSLVDAYNTGTVRGDRNVGGVVGSAWASLVEYVYNDGDVTGNESVGGVMGVYDSNTLHNAYNTGDVTGNYYVGGVVGITKYGDVRNVYNMGSVTGNGGYVGGVVGYNGKNAEICNVYNLGSVKGDWYCGGVVGANYSGGTVINGYYGVFDATDNISGIIVTGYKRHGDDTKTLSQAEFNDAFWQGLSDYDKENVWKVYNDNVSPLLKYWLKPITVTGNSDSKTYTYNGTGQSMDKGNLTYGGAVDESLIFVGSKTNAGSYSLSDLLYSTQHGYDITVNEGVKGFEIGKADLTISAGGGSITYGDGKKDFGCIGNNLLGADQGKNLSDLYGYQDGTVSYKTDAWLSDGKTNNAHADGYDITIESMSGMELGNYNISIDNSKPNKVVVNKATLTVTAEGNKELTYGSTTGPNYTYNVSGLVNGDSLNDANISGSAGFSSDGWDSTSNKTGNAGKYDINVDTSGLSSDNYIFEGASATNGLTINKADLTISANGGTITYGDGKTNFGFSVVSGLVNGDDGKNLSDLYGYKEGSVIYKTDAWLSDGKTNNANAAGYDITIEGIDGMELGNYNIKRSSSTPNKVIINKANLIAVADKAEVFAGDLLPQLTCKLEGLANGDTAGKFGGLSFMTNANTGVAGSYGIFGALGNNDWQTNYTFTDAEGNATAFVVQAARNITDVRQDAALRYLLQAAQVSVGDDGRQPIAADTSVLIIDDEAVKKE